MKRFIGVFITTTLCTLSLSAQTLDEVDEFGNVNRFDANGQIQNFNKHKRDSAKQDKIIPKGIKVWTIDRRFGDIQKAELDTLSHLFMKTTLNTGRYGEYNTIGNNYSAREHRVFIDRTADEQFIFTEPYSFAIKKPWNFQFTNTLSPYTNITYDNCGNKTNGEDHIDALFAVNAGKRLGFGFDLNYLYARGYYDNQSVSHFGATFFASYIGDKYNLHALFSTYHQKAAENGGIANDDYVTHPQMFTENYGDNEIPTVLDENWNRNDNQHFFLSHRYNVGFYRKVKMTDDEIKARQFAVKSKKVNEQQNSNAQQNDNDRRKSNQTQTATYTGRPKDAIIAGDEPTDGTVATPDTTRIKVADVRAMDSLLAVKARQDSIDATMKSEYVPVTSFIHTLSLDNHRRIYQAYKSPADYYANTYYNEYDGHKDNNIYDLTRMTDIKNTLAIALLEGFNKYAKAGLKVFAAHEFRTFELPVLMPTDNTRAQMSSYDEHNISIGGQLAKTLGKTVHYNLTAETWLAGEDAGQLKIDAAADVNFPLFGDTVNLQAKGFIYRLNPTFYYRHYHARNLWWDNDLGKEQRSRIEGMFAYGKSRTKLRIAYEELTNYTYFGMQYNKVNDSRTSMDVKVYQNSSMIHLLTAQLYQDFTLGILNWENIITYQKTSDKDVLPLPELNLYTNLYLKFKIAKVLGVELGADAVFFTNYFARDFSPALNQFAVQKNIDSRVKLGSFPIVTAYANFNLKRTRFFVMMTNIAESMGNKKYFMAPHYPLNGSVLRFGLSWNFAN